MTDSANTTIEIDFQRLRNRDRSAFRAAYDAYVGLLLYTAVRVGMNRADAKDIVQDVFVKLWEHAATIENEGALKTWLVIATRNRAIDYLRQRKFSQSLDTASSHSVQGNTPEAANNNDTLWHEIQVSLVGDIVEELCIETNETSFRRFYVEGKSAKDIASENAEPISTVTNRLSRMRKAFKLKFTERLQALHDASPDE